MSDWETQKKALLPYLQRAAEIEAVDPKVAYYCRLYAVEQGIKLEQRDQKADDLLELVLNQLERDKPHLVLDTSVDLEHCEKFALSVYIKARKRDEQGISDRDTAKAYYAAFNFIEILKQFGALSPDVERERRFAVFRAAEIKRCLDEGKSPPPLTPAVHGDGEDRHAGAGAAGAAPKEETPPLIDYDPGYVIGSKILMMDGDSALFRRGTIRGKAQEVGGFFNIQAEDGSECQLGALFLAPDLSAGDTVTYFFPDGSTSTCTVLEMNASEWPPLYTLKLGDGSLKSVKHSQFVLNDASMEIDEQDLTSGAEVSSPTDQNWLKGSSDSVKPLQRDSSISQNSDDSGRKVRRQTSWLVTKEGSKRNLNGQASMASGGGSGSSAVAAMGIQGVTSVKEDQPMVPESPPPRYPSAVPKKPLTVEEYYQDGSNEYYAMENPKVTVTGYAAIAKSKPVPEPSLTVQRPPGFEPDAGAIKQAKKCAHNATAALDFSDVDHAIKCLQDALRCLTQPPSQSS